MPTIFRLSVSELRSVLRVLCPEVEETEAAVLSLDQLKVRISEWLLLHGYSCLHDFQRPTAVAGAEEGGSGVAQWVHPSAFDCDCCWRFRVGRRKIPDPVIPGMSESVSWTPPRREDQMICFGGPWVLEETRTKRGKTKYHVRSHLLKTSSERSTYID